MKSDASNATTFDKQGILDLVSICVLKGVLEVIVSAGSRSAPLTLAFARHPAISLRVVIDERSAAYVALGIALKTQQPVVLVCTSGTAALNLSPAIAEAYYQRVPLLILTADRPPEQIDQNDGQAIRQNGVFDNFVARSFVFPTDTSKPADRRFAQRIANEAINSCIEQHQPTHINVPMREPLYDMPQHVVVDAKALMLIEPKIKTSDNISFSTQSRDIIKKSQKILLLFGQMNRTDFEGLVAANFGLFGDVTAQIYLENGIRDIDFVIDKVSKNGLEQAFLPDVLVTFGGDLLSKKVKIFFKNNPPKLHIHVSAFDKPMNSFFGKYNVNVFSKASYFLNQLIDLKSDSKQDIPLYKDFLKQIGNQKIINLNIEQTIYNHILTHLPQRTNLHLGNSLPIRRVSELDLRHIVEPTRQIFVNANRGTSGIDGCVSTAVGSAIVNEKSGIDTVLIVGDLSFVYDSNGLWNDYVASSLKIVVMNNAGGQIFSKTVDGIGLLGDEERKRLFVASQKMNIEPICKAFEVGYCYFDGSTSAEGFECILKDFFALGGASVLEVRI